MALTRRQFAAAVIAGALTLASIGPAWAPIYMRIKSMSAGSAVSGEWIEIISMTPALDPNALPPGRGTLAFVRRYDKASPLLADARASGRSFAIVDLSLPARGGSTVEYQLQNVRVTSYNLNGAGADATESITITYEKISRSQ